MKTLLVLLVATLCEAVGETFLSSGMRSPGPVSLSSLSGWIGLVLSVVKNLHVTAGVIFMACFFYLYLATLSWSDLSYALPLTSMSYVFAALFARFFLRESISWYRWTGTLVILIGISLIAMDESRRTVASERKLGLTAEKEISGGPLR